jgi:hypothetical protein
MQVWFVCTTYAMVKTVALFNLFIFGICIGSDLLIFHYLVLCLAVEIFLVVSFCVPVVDDHVGEHSIMGSDCAVP